MFPSHELARAFQKTFKIAADIQNIKFFRGRVFLELEWAHTFEASGFVGFHQALAFGLGLDSGKARA